MNICRVCACTNDDCRDCIRKTGTPCYWVDSELCSACAVLQRQLAKKQGEINESRAKSMRGGRR